MPGDVQMPNRAALHQLVDQLPATEIGRARHVLAALLEAAEEEDPVLRSLRSAPVDDEVDEVETPEERSAVEAALQEAREGRPGLSTEELERELGLR
jgi:hypothetical protein